MKNKAWKNRGGKDQPGRDGHGESIVATHSCYVQSEILNEAKLKKKKKKKKKRKKKKRDIHRSEGEQG